MFSLKVYFLFKDFAFLKHWYIQSLGYPIQKSGNSQKCFDIGFPGHYEYVFLIEMLNITKFIIVF